MRDSDLLQLRKATKGLRSLSSWPVAEYGENYSADLNFDDDSEALCGYKYVAQLDSGVRVEAKDELLLFEKA